MKAQKVFVPVRLLNEAICLTCPDLQIEDKVTRMYAEEHIFYQHIFSCENVNRCERISNDVEKVIKEKIEHVENASGNNNPRNGSELSEV